MRPPLEAKFVDGWKHRTFCDGYDVVVIWRLLCVTYQSHAFCFSVSRGVSEFVSVPDQVIGGTKARVTVLRNPEDPFDLVKQSNYLLILPYRWRNTVLNDAK